MRKSALLQDLHNKKNYFEEGAFNGASSFFLFVNVFLGVLTLILLRERGKVIKKGTGHFSSSINSLVWINQKVFIKKIIDGMNKRKINTVSEEQKMTIQLWLGVSLAIFGIILIIASFLCPPLGIISASVLAAIGEVFTFSGSLIGIDYHYKFKKYEIVDERVERYEDSSDNIADDEHNA